MDLIVIALAALLAAGLTLFSGFGVGTLLLPVFALFFPVAVAVAMTAVVHLANNLFKLLLLGSHADRAVVLRFGLPAIAAAVAGALLLGSLAEAAPLLRYTLAGATFRITPVKLTVALLMAFFALAEVHPALQRLTFERRYLPLGGLASGFFGGLSGHQGAFRAAFLVRLGLGKEAFVATGVVIACLVDLSRLSVYATQFGAAGLGEHMDAIGAGVLSAFAGSYLGARLLGKVTYRAIQLSVAGLMLVIALGLGTGIL
jgi:uncharacterized membrane protein YfcA